MVNNMTLTREQIAGLRSLLAKATPGPWQSKNEHEWDEIIGNIDGPDAGQFHYTHICSVDMNDLRTPEQRANAAIIAAAINALPALLDELDALRALRARVEAAPVETLYHLGGGLLAAELVLPEVWVPLDGQRVRLLAVDAGEVG